jgi:tetratricopeptide (TPR) repeat protein
MIITIDILNQHQPQEALHKAAQENNLQEIMRLLDGKLASVDDLDSIDEPALTYACAKGNYKAVMCLVSYGAKVDAGHCNGMICLDYCTSDSEIGELIFKSTQDTLGETLKNFHQNNADESEYFRLAVLNLSIATFWLQKNTQLEESARHLASSINFYKNLKNIKFITTLCQRIGKIYFLRNEIKEAKNFLSSSYGSIKMSTDKIQIARAAFSYGEFLAQNMEGEAAINFYLEAYIYFQELGEKSSMATSAYNHALILREQGKYIEAQAKFLLAYGLYKILKDEANIADAAFEYAELLNQQSKFQDAECYYLEAFKLYEKLNYEDMLVESASRLKHTANAAANCGLTLLTQQKLQSAVEYFNRASFFYNEIKNHEQYAKMSSLITFANAKLVDNKQNKPEIEDEQLKKILNDKKSNKRKFNYKYHAFLQNQADKRSKETSQAKINEVQEENQKLMILKNTKTS